VSAVAEPAKANHTLRDSAVSCFFIPDSRADSCRMPVLIFHVVHSALCKRIASSPFEINQPVRDIPFWDKDRNKAVSTINTEEYQRVVKALPDVRVAKGITQQRRASGISFPLTHPKRFSCQR